MHTCYMYELLQKEVMSEHFLTCAIINNFLMNVKLTTVLHTTSCTVNDPISPGYV